MKIKRFVGFTVTAIVVLFIITYVFVDGLKSDASVIGTVTKEDLATLPIEKTLTYEEMEQYMEGKNYTLDQISNFSLKYEEDNDTRFAILRLDGWSYRGTVNGANVNYSIIPELVVGLEYQNGLSSPEKIVSIEAPTFDNSGGDNCSFYGSFSYKLVSGNEMFTALRGYIRNGGNLEWEVSKTVDGENQDSVFFKMSDNNMNKAMDVSHQETYYDSDMKP